MEPDPVPLLLLAPVDPGTSWHGAHGLPVQALLLLQLMLAHSYLVKLHNIRLNAAIFAPIRLKMEELRDSVVVASDVWSCQMFTRNRKQAKNLANLFHF